MEIPQISTPHNGFLWCGFVGKVFTNGPVDNRKVIIQIRQFFYISALGFNRPGFPVNQKIVVYIFLINVTHESIKVHLHSGSLLPFPNHIINLFKIPVIICKLDNDTIRVVLNKFAIGFKVFNQIQK